MEEPFISNPYDSSQPMSKTFDFKPDLVVLELSTPFTRTSVVAPACLPKTQINTESSCFASGWGKQEQTYGPYSPINPLNYTLPKITKYSKQIISYFCTDVTLLKTWSWITYLIN